MPQLDLDTELLRIRDFRSRIYFTDALRSYRAGAMRAAIASAWVALVYDLLRKYRELASSGDREALAFLKEWDTAVQNSNTSKLLETERSILDHAHTKMGLMNAIGLRSLKRLLEDRHLCAHPAFQSNDELYEPTDELVKVHLCVVIDVVLAQKPLQGRGIFEVFSADIISSGFPTAKEGIVDYVEQKYLSQMRESVLRNFGIVLGKALILGTPVEWQKYRQRTVFALSSIKSRRPLEWDHVALELVRLIDEDAPANRVRSVLVLSSFPELLAKLNAPTLTALTQTLAASDDLLEHPEVFHAADLDGIGDALIKRFEALDFADAAKVLAAAAPLALWPNALKRYSEAGSYRGAEAFFESFVVPFQNVITSENLDQLLAVIPGNGQIWDASGTPELLEKFLRGVQPVRPSDSAAAAMYRALRYRRERYEATWEMLKRFGWQPPTLKDAEEP
jgi:hypothetical protein